MANNLHRNLTGYSAVPVNVDHPAVPKSGEPVRFGKLVGVALINEQFGFGPGGYRRQIGNIYMSQPIDPASRTRIPDGTTPVSFQFNQWRLSVKNDSSGNEAGPGTEVYYVDEASDTLRVNPTPTKTAFAGYLMDTIAADGTKADAIVLLTPAAPTDLS